MRPPYGAKARRLRIADRYAANQGEYPWRFALSGLAARLLMEQHAATLRWARWAEQVVVGWETPLAKEAAWGVEALRASGKAFPLDADPVREVVGQRPQDDG
jgi:hypothetical protein